MNETKSSEAPETEPRVCAELPIVCTPGAIPAGERERWIEVGRAVYGAVEEVRELPDGYAFRLPDDVLMIAAEHIDRDRRCCAFLHWVLVVEPAGGPLWLHVTGPEGTKRVLRDGFEGTDVLPEHVARAAGFRTNSRAPLDLDRALAIAASMDDT